MPGSDKVVKNRFFVDADITEDSVRVVDADVLKQWRSVLRLHEGDVVELVHQSGWEAVGRIVQIGKSAAVVAVESRRRNTREPHRHVRLYCAMLKRENFEWVAQKAVETGVSRIVPLLTERTVKLGFKRERLEAIIREAAEQSGRGIVPSLADPMPLSDAFIDSAAIKHRYFFDTEAARVAQKSDDGSAAAFIGPEGGWSEAERLAAVASGLKTAGLGPLVLRAETAAVIASYVLAQA